MRFKRIFFWLSTKKPGYYLQATCKTTSNYLGTAESLVPWRFQQVFRDSCHMDARPLSHGGETDFTWITLPMAWTS